MRRIEFMHYEELHVLAIKRDSRTDHYNSILEFRLLFSRKGLVTVESFLKLSCPRFVNGFYINNFKNIENEMLYKSYMRGMKHNFPSRLAEFYSLYTSSKIKKGDKVRFFHSLHKTALESTVTFVDEDIVYIKRPPNFKGGNKVILRKLEDIELVNE